MRRYRRDCGIDPLDSAAIAQFDLPASLHTPILSRIDQLSTRQQAALKLASVIGRLFQFAWLHGAYPILGAPEGLKADLDELARLELTPLDTPENVPYHREIMAAWAEVTSAIAGAKHLPSSTM